MIKRTLVRSDYDTFQGRDPPGGQGPELCQLCVCEKDLAACGTCGMGWAPPVYSRSEQRQEAQGAPSVDGSEWGQEWSWGGWVPKPTSWWSTVNLVLAAGFTRGAQPSWDLVTA